MATTGFIGDKSFLASPTPWIRLAKFGVMLVGAGMSRSGRAPSQYQRRRSRIDSIGCGSWWTRHGLRECFNGGRQPHRRSWNSGGSIWLGLVTCVCACVSKGQRWPRSMRSMVGTPWPVSKIGVGKRGTVVAHRGLSKWKDVTCVARHRDLGGACSWSPVIVQRLWLSR